MKIEKSPNSTVVDAVRGFFRCSYFCIEKRCELWYNFIDIYASREIYIR